MCFGSYSIAFNLASPSAAILAEQFADSMRVFQYRRDILVNGFWPRAMLSTRI